MRPIEQGIAKKLIELSLAAGYTVSVFDGEETALKRSTDADAIMAALGSTDEDTLILRKPEQLTKDTPIGSILLIWGNEHDLISDHTDNVATNELVARAMMEATGAET